MLILEYVYRFNSYDNQEFERWIYKDISDLPANLSRVKQLWRLLYARNYLVFSFESLFLFFLSSIKEESLNFDDFFLKVRSLQAENSYLLTQFNNSLDTPISKVLSKVFDSTKIPEDSSFYEPTLMIDLENIKRNIPQEKLYKFVINPVFCLFSLYNRYSQIELSDEEREFLEMGDTFRISLQNIFNHIKVSLQKNIKLSEFLRELYYSNILPRHLNVAHDKYASRNLDTFHYQLDENQFKFVQRDRAFEPMYNFMKQNEMLNFLEDLNLIERNENKEIKITESGLKIRQEFYE